MLSTSATARRRRRQESRSGQIAITFAITFGLFLFGLLLAVVDLATLYGQQAQIAKAAQDGAVAGAADVDLAHFRATGQVRVNGASYQGACQAAATADFASGTTTCITINGNLYTVEATVTKHVSLPVRLGSIGQVWVSSKYVAIAQCGTNSAGTAGGC